MVSLRLHITGQVSGTKAIMRAVRAEGDEKAQRAEGCGWRLPMKAVSG